MLGLTILTFIFMFARTSLAVVAFLLVYSLNPTVGYILAALYGLQSISGMLLKNSMQRAYDQAKQLGEKNVR